jgi:hypothetical protein
MIVKLNQNYSCRTALNFQKIKSELLLWHCALFLVGSTLEYRFGARGKTAYHLALLGTGEELHVRCASRGHSHLYRIYLTPPPPHSTSNKMLPTVSIVWRNVSDPDPPYKSKSGSESKWLQKIKIILSSFNCIDAPLRKEGCRGISYIKL